MRRCIQPEPCMHTVGVNGDRRRGQGHSGNKARKTAGELSTEDDGVESERGEAVSTRQRGACGGTWMTDMDEELDVDADERPSGRGISDNYSRRGRGAEKTTPDDDSHA